MANKSKIAIPAVPAGQPAPVMRFLQSIRDTVLQLVQEGKSRYVSVADLEKAGISSNRLSGSANPPKPAYNLKFQPNGVLNKLTWTLPNDTDISHIEVWCGFNTNILSQAIRVGVVSKPVAEFVHSGLNMGVNHYYWIRTVAYSGAYSTWEPKLSQGGMLIPSTTVETINELLSQLSSDITYETVHRIVADSFEVVQPEDGLEDGRKVFQVGKIGDTTVVGIRGDMILDGSVLARMLHADIITGKFLSASAKISLGAGGTFKIADGGKMVAGNGNVFIDTSGNKGSIIVGDDGAVDNEGNFAQGKDFCVLEDGDLVFWTWDSDLESHDVQRGVAKIKTGVYDPLDPNTFIWLKDGRKAVQLQGVWRREPQIVISPKSMPLFKGIYYKQDQKVEFEVQDIVLTGDRKYAFVPSAKLLLANSSLTPTEAAHIEGAGTSFVNYNDSMLYGQPTQNITLFSWSKSFSNLPKNLRVLKAQVTITKDTIIRRAKYVQYSHIDQPYEVWTQCHYTLHGRVVAEVGWSDGTKSYCSVERINNGIRIAEASRAGCTAISAKLTCTVWAAPTDSYQREKSKYGGSIDKPSTPIHDVFVTFSEPFGELAGGEIALDEGSLNWTALGE